MWGQSTLETWGWTRPHRGQRLCADACPVGSQPLSECGGDLGRGGRGPQCLAGAAGVSGQGSASFSGWSCVGSVTRIGEGGSSDHVLAPGSPQLQQS